MSTVDPITGAVVLVSTCGALASAADAGSNSPARMSAQTASGTGPYTAANFCR